MAEYDEQEQPASPSMNADDVKDLYAALRAAWSARNAEYGRMRRLYRGDHWGEDNPAPSNRYALVANYVMPFADKDVQILMGQLPGIQVPPPTADQGGRQFAERIEGLLYGNWRENDAHMTFLKVAWNATVLRRGIIYYWFDHDTGHPRFKSCTPENFYPVYDGDEVVECIYVSRRLTRSLHRQYPQLAEQIYSDDGMEHVYEESSGWSQVSGGVTDALGAGGQASERLDSPVGYTTVIDWYDAEGNWLRQMGDAIHTQNLQYPSKGVPFLEIVNKVQGEDREPVDSLAQVVNLNLYYNEVLSQRADVIRKWANPPVVDRGSGVDPAKIKQTLAGDGGIIPINPKGALELLVWQGQMPEITEQLAEIKEAMYDLSGKPRSSFGQTITNQSGVTTNLALTPTLQSNEMRETMWGTALTKLNRRILELYEKFRSGEAITFKGTKPGKAMKNAVPFEVEIKGKEINGWYESRMKWPSAIRVDDPAFVQMEISKMTSQPQAQSVYDTLENLGVEDVESHIDRIRAEHEDPRLHPEIMQQAIDSLASLGGAMMPPELGEMGRGMVDPLMGGGGGDPAEYNQAMIAGGLPDRAEAA